MMVMPQDSQGPDDNRKALSRAYKELLVEVSGILFRHDPIGINFDDNTDEYDSEAETILPRLRADMTVEEARSVVHEELVRWFSHEDAGSEEEYASIAAEILAAYQRQNLR